MESVSLWNQIGQTIGEMIGLILNWTRDTVWRYAPGFLSGLLVLVLGWLMAAIGRNVVRKLLRALGLDVVAERTGARRYLQDHEIKMPPSAMAGWLVYIVIVYAALVMAFERMSLEAGRRLLTDVASFIPKILVVVLLLALGVWLSRWIGGLLGRAARLAGVPFHELIGTLVRIGGIVLAVVVSLDYLGLASRQTLLVGLAVIALGFIAMGVLFAVCARDLVGNLLARNFVAGEFKIGDRIRVGAIEGRVESIGANVLRLRNGDTSHLVPHGQLVREPIERLGPAEPQPATAGLPLP